MYSGPNSISCEPCIIIYKRSHRSWNSLVDRINCPCLSSSPDNFDPVTLLWNAKVWTAQEMSQSHQVVTSSNCTKILKENWFYICKMLCCVLQYVYATVLILSTIPLQRVAACRSHITGSATYHMVIKVSRRTVRLSFSISDMYLDKLIFLF